MTLLLPVKHSKQKFQWDCGITCLRMLIDFYQDDSTTFEQLFQAYQCNHSTWTIDLLYLLHQSNIRAILHTVTIGCSSSYEQVPYYEQVIDKDRERVDRLFQSETANIKIGSVEWKEIKTHLTEHQTPCLVLIDANKLECTTCSKTLVNRLLDKLLPAFHSTYQGHYILVIGFHINENTEYIRYVDPGRNDEFCMTTVENFNQARTAFGTDEDIIFCYEKTKK